MYTRRRLAGISRRSRPDTLIVTYITHSSSFINVLAQLACRNSCSLIFIKIMCKRCLAYLIAMGRLILKCLFYNYLNELIVV